MDSLTPNQLAIRNGNFGEQCAMKILNERFGNVEFVNELIDYYVDAGIPIEVKTCQELINRGDRPNNRLGRFTFMKEQHKTLLDENGYYLFIVKNGDFLICFKVIRADEVFMFMDEFKFQLTWGFLIG